VVWDLPSTAIGEGICLKDYTVNIDFTNTQDDLTLMMNTTDRAIQLIAENGVEGGATVDVTVTANYLTPLVDGATTLMVSFTIPVAGQGKCGSTGT